MMQSASMPFGTSASAEAVVTTKPASSSTIRTRSEMTGSSSMTSTVPTSGQCTAGKRSATCAATESKSDSVPTLHDPTKNTSTGVTRMGNGPPEQPLYPIAVRAAEQHMPTPRNERRMKQLLDALCDATRLKIVRALSDTTLAAGDLVEGLFGRTVSHPGHSGRRV